MYRFRHSGPIFIFSQSVRCPGRYKSNLQPEKFLLLEIRRMEGGSELAGRILALRRTIGGCRAKYPDKLAINRIRYLRFLPLRIYIAIVIDEPHVGRQNTAKIFHLDTRIRENKLVESRKQYRNKIIYNRETINPSKQTQRVESYAIQQQIIKTYTKIYCRKSKVAIQLVLQQVIQQFNACNYTSMSGSILEPYSKMCVGHSIILYDLF